MMFVSANIKFVDDIAGRDGPEFYFLPGRVIFTRGRCQLLKVDNSIDLKGKK
jgi:hypothetical protein